jgi:OPT family oligopeptide transporter
MNGKSYARLGPDYPGNRAEDVKDPSMGWMIAYLFTVSFLGIFSLVPLRQIMILKYKLTYPSGTATALLINSFHTVQGADIAEKQVACLGKFFGGSFLWSLFKWFWSGIGDSCGFDNFPILGLKAYANTFYFDFSMTYIGVGMICPHIVNCSVLLGAIISWGIMWPLISAQEGKWFPANLPSSDFGGLYGYKVFIAIALVLGDGLYNFLKISVITLQAIYRQTRNDQHLPVSTEDSILGEVTEEISQEEKQRNKVFLEEGVPFWVAGSGYVALACISMTVIPQMFPAVRWYYVLGAYILAPVLAFCNAYGCGLTDWSLGTTYGKLGLFVFAGWAGSNGGVMAGLVGCGVMMSIVSTAADIMQDFRTGYLTLSSPRSMFISQLAGTVMGCITAPLTFWLFWTSFDVGNPEGEYKAPYGVLFRTMAIVGVEGLSTLPPHCLELCCIFFVAAFVINIIRDTAPKNVSAYIPIPMAMAIPFYIGAYFAIDMFLGTVILFFWQRLSKQADVYAPAVASGLICGDGIWSVPSAALSLAKINPPLCMMFVKSADAIIGG